MMKSTVLKIIRHFGYELIKVNKEPSYPAAKNALLKRKSERNQPVRLHFGCGPRVLKNWINIDLKYQPYEPHMEFMTEKYYPEEIRGDRSDFFAFDVTKWPLPFEDGSVDVIFHEDFLEHLSQKGQILFLSETYRILKIGGVHRTNTPDLGASMQKNSDFKKGFKGVFVDEWDRHGHSNVLTPGMLEEMATMVGYSKILFRKRDQSISRDIPLEYRPSRTNSQRVNIFADLIK